VGEENAYLVLGCFGRVEDGFILCPSTENRILKLDDTLNDFDDMCEYLEAVGLFDRQMLDSNAIRHLIYNLQDKFDQKIRRLWSEQQYHLLERYLQMHKQCGMYAKLILVPEELDIPKPHDPKSVIIRGTPEKESSHKKPELKIIRGRR
jgi:hypothetical protein